MVFLSSTVNHKFFNISDRGSVSFVTESFVTYEKVLIMLPYI